MNHVLPLNRELAKIPEGWSLRMIAASGKQEAQVSFAGEKQLVRIMVGRTLLDAARAARLEVSSVCAGRGICGKCRVIVTGGSEELSPMTDLERMSLSRADIEQGFRIGCLARVISAGSISVQIPLESLTATQQLLAAGIQPKVALSPSVKKYFVKLPPASLTDFRPDFERLVETLQLEHGLLKLQIGYDALRELPYAIRKGEWSATATVADDKKIVWVEPGRTENRLYGFAVDIGTTKLAGYMVDLNTGALVATASKTNPQASFGADVISRISYTNKGKAELQELQSQALQGVNSLLLECCTKASVEPDEVFQVVVVGNTAMHHIFLRIPPEYVALAPYTPALRSSFQTRAREIGITSNAGSVCNALPCVAGFVGADAVADILATQIQKSPVLTLLVDIGTNTEIVLGDQRGLVCCSSPSGPAFEGAQIKHGMTAEVGAIERVWIDPQTLEAEYSTIRGEKARGICGSGIIDAVASLRQTGIINSTGRINSRASSKRIRTANGFAGFVLAWKNETQTGYDIVVTQNDIEEVKLAKAAVYAGITILAKHLNVAVSEIKKVLVAGGFGTYVDPQSARTIGMYPGLPLGFISFVGNTAGSGARMALASKDQRTEAQRIAEKLKYVELGADPEFKQEFADALYIPHRHADLFPT